MGDRMSKPTKRQQITIRTRTANAAQIAASRARMAEKEQMAMKTHKATIITLEGEIKPFDWAASVGK